MDPLAATRVADLVSAVEQGDAEYIDRMLALQVQVDEPDVLTGNSALHAAVLYHLELLPALLKHAANPDALDVGGATPLSCVLHELGEGPVGARRQQLVEAAAHLLHAGADPRAGASDQSALELARLYELPDVEALLVNAGAAVTQ
ncbi:hypothetical protein M8A51_23265 [Schlegelella sp. S2-27]|uniref:Ankyrin repeat domain-containing protein n=1 Tax=Caldimonas mangrovi TaxID=2944811 RepID=A0ABT0YVY5_9BURK|nr:hypothetical protein [Caldimonas mangrovi]MCM5682459.1 hypothetical protein [Caldimonas mangrovi]